MLQFFRTYALRHWFLYLLGLICLLITNVIVTLIPLKIKDIVQILELNTTDASNLTSLCWQMILLALGLCFFRTLSRIFIFTPGRLVEERLRNNLYEKLINLSVVFYRKEKVGDIMSRLTNDIQSLRLTVSVVFLAVCNVIIIYVMVCYQMASIHLKLTLYLLLPVPIVIFIVLLCARSIHHHVFEASKKLGTLTNFIVETLANIKVIKNYGMESLLNEQFARANFDLKQVNIILARWRSIMFPFIGVVGSLGYFILFFLGIGYLSDGSLTLGGFIAMSSYVVLLTFPTVSLSWIINLVQRGLIALDRINTILDAKVDIPPNEDREDDPLYKQDVNAPPAIEIKNLSFSYKEGERILNNVSLSIKPGQIIGIFGRTGSGKSTLSNILANLEPYYEGELCFNNHNVKELPLSWLRKMTSYVPQRSFLFSLSIKDNIAYAKPLADDLSVQSMAQTVYIHDEVLSFPDHYDTLIGERGVLLSGGQKSRLCLARALFKDASFIILDDCLASVDHKKEAELIHSLKKRFKNKTVLIIDNRVSALRYCDYIFVLDKGCITHQGTHETLLNTCDVYKHIWFYQQSDKL